MTKEFTKGTVIFNEGNVGDSCFDVISGSVGIYTDYGSDVEQHLTTIEAGHIFGELALVDSYPRSATAVAESDVKVNELTLDDFRSYFENDPEKVTFIIREMSERIGRLTKDYEEVVETIGELYPQNADRKPTIADKIKQFAAAYKMAAKNNKISREALYDLVQDDHNDGYTDNVETYSKGTIIFKEGEPGKCMYDIFTGSVNIYTGYGTPEEKLITTIGVSKFFGEMGLINDAPRTATAVVNMDHTMIQSLYMDDFKDLFKKNPVKIGMLVKYMAFRVRKLTDQYTDACKLVYEVSEAEEAGNVSEELKKKVRAFQAQY
ncbi:MAG: cyclic nucleotide-binding domain-containing protein [Lachnospiraceae bacterium]|nr:cyclic nucleotide-binding domain-containing protein [Lachnospiraceae bacterium]